MTQSGNNILRTIFAIILMGGIAVLVYVLSQKDEKQPGPQNVGVASPTNYAPRNADTMLDFEQFNDGLVKPNQEVKQQPDDFGVGVTNVRVYNRDLNGDGRMDRITRTHIENGTSHFTNKYKIELTTDDGYVDITPDNLETLEGADCALQKLRFYFNPGFVIEKIGRAMGDDYITPTMAYRTIYKLTDNKLVQVSHKPITEVCDVSELFRQ